MPIPKKPNDPRIPPKHAELEKTYRETQQGMVGRAKEGFQETSPSLIEQVRNKRTQISERYNRQMMILNDLERRLKDSEPEEMIAAIKDDLISVDYC